MSTGSLGGRLMSPGVYARSGQQTPGEGATRWATASMDQPRISTAPPHLSPEQMSGTGGSGGGGTMKRGLPRVSSTPVIGGGVNSPLGRVMSTSPRDRSLSKPGTAASFDHGARYGPDWMMQHRKLMVQTPGGGSESNFRNGALMASRGGTRGGGSPRDEAEDFVFRKSGLI